MEELQERSLIYVQCVEVGHRVKKKKDHGPADMAVVHTEQSVPNSIAPSH